MRSLEPFDYFEPGDIHEASEILSARGEKAWILAGGIDLIPRIRKGTLKADHVINIQKITARLNWEFSILCPRKSSDSF